MITTCITDTAAHTWEQHACSSAYNRKLMITTAQPTLPPTPGSSAHVQASALASSVANCWAEAPIKIARMTLTIKLDGNWSSFQLANSTPPLSVTDSAIAPSARIPTRKCIFNNVVFIMCGSLSYLVVVIVKQFSGYYPLLYCYPKGCAATSEVRCQCNT